jgi:hypothetical protein
MGVPADVHEPWQILPGAICQRPSRRSLLPAAWRRSKWRRHSERGGAFPVWRAANDAPAVASTDDVADEANPAYWYDRMQGGRMSVAGKLTTPEEAAQDAIRAYNDMQAGHLAGDVAQLTASGDEIQPERGAVARRGSAVARHAWQHDRVWAPKMRTF